MKTKHNSDPAPTVHELIEAYFERPLTLDKAAAKVGMTTREYVAVLINELFGIPGDEQDLDSTDGASHYGHAYDAYELAQIPRMLKQGNSLIEIAREFGRSVLGVGWKALGIPEVTRWLQQRYESSSSPTAFLIQQSLSPMSITKRTANYALGLSKLHVFYDLARPGLGDVEPAEVTAEQAIALANSVLDDQLLQPVSLWLRLSHDEISFRSELKILQGEELLRAINTVFALQHLFTTPEEAALNPPRGEALVAYDIAGERFVAAGVKGSEAGADGGGAVLLTGVERFIGRKLTQIHPQLQHRAHQLAYERNGEYDPQLDKAANAAIARLSTLLNIQVPAQVAIGGSEEAARELLGV